MPLPSPSMKLKLCLKVNCSMSNDVEKDSWKIDGQEVAKKPSTKNNKD